jgi:hypothetical protein
MGHTISSRGVSSPSPNVGILIQDKDYFHFDPVGVDFIVFYGYPHFQDAQSGDTPEGTGGAGEAYLYGILKTFGRLSNDISYSGYIGAAHKRYLLWRCWSAVEPRGPWRRKPEWVPYLC